MKLEEKIEALIDAARDHKDERYVSKILGGILARQIAEVVNETMVPREAYNSLSENYQSYRREVEAKIAEIPRLREEIEAVRSTVTCPACGNRFLV